MAISKPFAVATEGPTIDGRNISREWIVQMAEKYDPAVYTSVADLEHYLSPMPDSTFSAQGKVVSLSTREVEIFGEKKLQLMAVVDANDSIIKMQKEGKKAFSSIDVLPNFLNKGFAYLRRLAFTDEPASIGTEAMQFSVGTAQVERYAFTNEIEIEFEAEEKKPSAGDLLFTKVKDLLGLGKKDTDAQFADQCKAIETVALSQKDLLEKFARIEKDLADQGASVKLTTEAIETRRKELVELTEQLSRTPDGTTLRPAATGGDGEIKADC